MRLLWTVAGLVSVVMLGCATPDTGGDILERDDSPRPPPPAAPKGPTDPTSPPDGSPPGSTPPTAVARNTEALLRDVGASPRKSTDPLYKIEMQTAALQRSVDGGKTFYSIA